MNFKHFAFGLVILAGVSAIIFRDVYLPTKADKTAAISPLEKPTQTSGVSEPVINSAVDKANQKALLDERLGEERIAELLEKHITPEMRQEINELLKPSGHTYKEVKTERGGYIELGKRATSVSVAVIDDDGQMIITDLTSPLPEL